MVEERILWYEYCLCTFVSRLNIQSVQISTNDATIDYRSGPKMPRYEKTAADSDLTGP